MMIDCNKAGALIDQSDSEKISWLQKRKLKLHLKMCELCRKYDTDNKVLGKIIKLAGVRYSNNCISEKEKQQMKEKLATEGS